MSDDDLRKIGQALIRESLTASPGTELLRAAIAAAVPFWIEDVRPLSDEYRQERAHACSQFVAEHGDNILFRGPKKGDSAKAFNHLAEGLALAAFSPGGVTFLGDHWSA